MVYEEKDSFKKHVKKIENNSNETLTIENIKKLVHSDIEAKDLLSDDEIEGILLICAAKSIQKKKNISSKEMSEDLNLEEDYWVALTDGDIFPTPSELVALRTFVSEN